MRGVVGVAWVLVGCVPRFETVGCYDAWECPADLRCIEGECVAPLRPDARPADAAVMDAADAEVPPRQLNQRGAERFGAFIADIGDVDGDGFADVAIGASLAEGGACGADCGQVFVYRGGPGGLMLDPSAVIDGPERVDARFGRRIAGLGDVNGDGLSDFAVATREGPVFVFYGSADGLVGGTAERLAGARLPAGLDYPNHGAWLAGGDIDGDGLGDLVTLSLPYRTRAAVCGEGLTTVHGAAAAVWVMYGAPDGLDTGRPTDRVEWRPPAAELCTCGPPQRRDCRVGSALATVDLDGTAGDEVALGASAMHAGRGLLQVFGGAPPAPVGSVMGQCDGAHLGDADTDSIRPGGDLDGDGRDDLIANLDRLDDCASPAGALGWIRGAADGPEPPRLLVKAPADATGQAIVDAFAVSRGIDGVTRRVFLLTRAFRPDVEAPPRSRVWTVELDGPRASTPKLLFESPPDQEVPGMIVPFAATPLAPSQLLVSVRPVDGSEAWGVRVLQLP